MSAVDKLLASCRKDIFYFAKVMGFNPTFLQERFMRNFQNTIHEMQRRVDPLLREAERHRLKGDPEREEVYKSAALKVRDEIKRRFAIRSGQGSGKSACSTIVALWFLLQWSGARAIVTAPTARQVSDVWIAELSNRLMKGHPLFKALFDVQNKQVGAFNKKPKEWGLTSFAASRPENAQGLHADYQLIMIDEASGVDRDILETIYGTSSGPMNLVVLTGNPNTRSCGFYDCFRPENEHLYHTDHWSCEMLSDSVWFSTKRADDLADEFGRDSDVYRVRVKGEWPESDPQALLTEEEVKACMDPANQYACAIMNDTKRLAIDFARFGGDENCVVRRRGNAIAEINAQRRIEPSWAIAESFRMQTEAGWSNKETQYVADATGIGQGIIHRIYDADKKLHEYHNGGKANVRRDFENKITEAWFHLRKLIRAKQVYLPLDRQLITQLTTRNYMINEKSGKIMIETKDDYKSRTQLPSPDRADAVVMAFDDTLRSAQVSV